MERAGDGHKDVRVGKSARGDATTDGSAEDVWVNESARSDPAANGGAEDVRVGRASRAHHIGETDCTEVPCDAEKLVGAQKFRLAVGTSDRWCPRKGPHRTVAVSMRRSGQPVR